MSKPTHYLRFVHAEDEADHHGVTFTVLGNGKVAVRSVHPYYEQAPARVMPIAEARNLYRKMTTELCEVYGEPHYVAP